ncbi:MAG TPA: ParB-like protein [Steroidobacteraceae bacterium]|nr:ParB-like protein [Steroidobacteraceae bacterium]
MAKLHEVEIHRLRPTQITVGMIEVQDKRDKLLAMKKHEQRDFMAAHPIPAVWGPDGKLYITDHHHLGRAASEAAVDTGFFFIEGDFSKLPIAQFWPKMNEAKWVHPIDQNGNACSFEQIPDHLEKLIDDPYRSLAGYVRNAGGYEKTPTAFAEFLWADFFRPRVPIGPTRPAFHSSVDDAVALATSPAAAHLPGYKGPEASAAPAPAKDSAAPEASGGPSKPPPAAQVASNPAK